MMLWLEAKEVEAARVKRGSELVHGLSEAVNGSNDAAADAHAHSENEKPSNRAGADDTERSKGQALDALCAEVRIRGQDCREHRRGRHAASETGASAAATTATTLTTAKRSFDAPGSSLHS
jgi:hypothetical protein